MRTMDRWYEDHVVGEARETVGRTTTPA
ncbi:dehydratase, partial [Microbacterium testaceum]